MIHGHPWCKLRGDAKRLHPVCRHLAPLHPSRFFAVYTACRSHVRVPVSDLALSQLRTFFLGLHNARGLPTSGSTTLAYTTWVLLAQLADAD
jgi:hypothetical protein